MGESCNWTNVLSEGANLANLIFIKIDNAISMMSRGGLNCCFKLITSSSNAVYTYLKCNFIPISIYAEFSWNRFPSHTELIDIQLTLLLKVLYYDKLCGKNEILYNIIKKIESLIVFLLNIIMSYNIIYLNLIRCINYNILILHLRIIYILFTYFSILCAAFELQIFHKYIKIDYRKRFY